MLNQLGNRKTKMSGMTFRSNKCYLPIFEPYTGRLERYRVWWRKFISSCENESDMESKLLHYNGILINDAVVFDSEQDKTLFMLRWF